MRKSNFLTNDFNETGFFFVGGSQECLFDEFDVAFKSSPFVLGIFGFFTTSDERINHNLGIDFDIGFRRCDSFN